MRYSVRSALACASLALALSAVGLTTSSAQAASPTGLTPTLGQICQSTLGVSPNEAHHQACVASLAAALDAAGSAKALNISVTSAAPAPSYFRASSSVILREEQSACAQLGLDAQSGDIASCVAGLSSALFTADHPMD
ncbi:MAG: hypothetical protein P4L64_08425 [Caulobacteraceae bacterium]|nr:hypothetical protein [Caulobacteraceae bacterium]